ncbi:MAG: RHS repeat-associated core domain-containing protein, partial [Clostridia bacterium]|nr:RHS repeat-associated core domain-containing protein [Clostridia bacterium]
RRDYNPTHTTDYVGSFVYVDDELQYLLTPEGRVVIDGSNYEYQYFLKDHLGNTRITFNESGSIVQEDSYYPYGMNMAGLSHESGEDLPNKYRYNGKELQDDFGLGWYDYGARFYDPTGVHWTTVDPMAEKYNQWSPYNYVLNNPIKSIDPDGTEPFTLGVLAARAAIGAVLGAGIDITVQMTVSMSLGNQSFFNAATNIDWTSVGASAAIGRRLLLIVVF